VIKIFKILFVVITFQFAIISCYADSDGNNTLSGKDEAEVKDCFEKLNRGIFAFNNGLDKALFKPIATGYRKLPSPIRSGTGNAINNLSNLVTIPNNILQGDINSAVNNSFRFVINTTLGVLGIFDVASAIGLEKGTKEDYGQTFASWGVGPGCYVVLPILGPSTVRDATGSALNLFGGDPWYNITVENDTRYFKESDYYYSKMTSGVDFRAKNLESFSSLENNSIDFYATVKSLYLQDREMKISNSSGVIDTMNDSDWEEIDN
tara:strand:+ start:62 stop:853 length:792 start_codon:yes stop_codon:yes gene_type:complete